MYSRLLSIEDGFPIHTQKDFFSMWGDVESESGINDLATNVFSISFSFDAFLILPEREVYAISNCQWNQLLVLLIRHLKYEEQQIADHFHV